jgi:phage terminase large subunit-like protein
LGVSRAERNIAWIEHHLRIPEGKFVGKPVKLTQHQSAWMESIYGSPTRMFVLSMARKNAKTSFSAMLLLLHLCGPEARTNSQLFSAAQSRDQAGILFALAAKMVRMSQDLSSFVVVRDTAKQLFCPELGTLYRALSAEASTAYGLSPAFVVHDELGQVRGPRSELFEALETAAGAQEEPLSIIISTQAPTDSDLLSVLIDDALSGTDTRVKVELYVADDDLDPFGDEALGQANPHLGEFMNVDEVRRQAEQARRMPSREAAYRNLVLNQRVEANSPFVSRQVWQSNDGMPREDWTGFDVYAGLDLSEVQDLTALVLVASDNGVMHVRPTFWLPADGLADRARQDRVPYDVWANTGYLRTTPGKAIEYEYIAEYLRGVFDANNVRKLAFDRWNMRHLRPWLIRAGFSEAEIAEKFVEFGQGYASMSPALRELEANLLEGKLRHGGHPVLNMCAANSVVKGDEAGNRKLDKARSSGRIDGMVALAMAVAVTASESSDEQGNMDDYIDSFRA